MTDRERSAEPEGNGRGGGGGGRPTASSPRWVLRGMANLASVPAVVLMSASAGFAALARESGFTLGETLFLTLAVWALPSQVVFVGVVAAGAALPTAALAVTLSAVRFLPMVMAWVPVVRAPETPRWRLYGLSWFVAVTAWVFAMARLPPLPRAARLPFFAGFAVGLSGLNLVVVALAYAGLPGLPAAVAAALLLLTPVYFLLALWGAARVPADRLALVLGAALGPVFAVLVPELDLLLAGLLGGTLAYGLARIARRPRLLSGDDGREGSDAP